MAMAKPPFYQRAKGNPLTVEITKQANGTWEIEPAKGFQAEMKRRRDDDMTAITSHKGKDVVDEWKDRRAGGAPVLPPFKMNPNHIPIVMREGEDVDIVCPQGFAFVVWMDRDSNVSIEAGTPGNPFGWRLPQTASPGGKVPGAVQGMVGGKGPADQRFYKVTAFIYDETGNPPETVTVDPDGSCDR